MQQLLLRGYCLGAISEIHKEPQHIVFVVAASQRRSNRHQRHSVYIGMQAQLNTVMIS